MAAARYSIQLTPAAQRQLKKLNPQARRVVATCIDGLATDPRPHGFRKLEGADSFYRMRAGSYRVIYQVRDDVLQVLVVCLGDRKDVYRAFRRG